MKRYDQGFWGVGFDGHTDLWIRTPWFALELAVEALNHDEYKVWWGMKLAWSRRSNVKEGELMFLRSRKIVFHEIPKRLFYQRRVMG